VAVGASGHGKEARSRWFALGGLFAFAAVDEAAALHELLNDPLRSLPYTTGLLSYLWVLLVAVVMVLFRRFVARLPPPVRRMAAAGALLFAGSAMGVESVENLLAGGPDADPSLTAALVGTLSECARCSG
jgi:hypothetical protein